MLYSTDQVKRASYTLSSTPSKRVGAWNEEEGRVVFLTRAQFFCVLRPFAARVVRHATYLNFVLEKELVPLRLLELRLELPLDAAAVVWMSDVEADVLLLLDREGAWPEGICSGTCPCRSPGCGCHSCFFRV